MCDSMQNQAWKWVSHEEGKFMCKRTYQTRQDQNNHKMFTVEAKEKHRRRQEGTHPAPEDWPALPYGSAHFQLWGSGRVP